MTLQTFRRLIETKLPECAEFSSACKARKGAHSCAMLLPGMACMPVLQEQKPVTFSATQQADEKTSRPVTLVRKIALACSAV